MFGTVEVDESFFGAARPRGVARATEARARDAEAAGLRHIRTRRAGLHRDRAGCEKATLQEDIRGRIALESVVISDGWRGYDGLVDVGYDTHLRIRKVEDGRVRFAENGVHINGIESFCSFTKRRLAKFTASAGTSSFTSRNASGGGAKTLLP